MQSRTSRWLNPGISRSLPHSGGHNAHPLSCGGYGCVCGGTILPLRLSDEGGPHYNSVDSTPTREVAISHICKGY